MSHSPYSGSMISGALLVNSPQLCLASAYFVYNMIITRFELAGEWASLGTKYQFLRVSAPRYVSLAHIKGFSIADCARLTEEEGNGLPTSFNSDTDIASF